MKNIRRVSINSCVHKCKFGRKRNLLEQELKGNVFPVHFEFSKPSTSVAVPR